MKYLSLILFASICFSSCDKFSQIINKQEQLPYDTIFPGEYFPVYPGSWWKYVTYKGTYLTYESEPKYTLMHFTKGDKPGFDYCYKCFKDTYRKYYEELIDRDLYSYNYVYLPSILGRFISGYSFVFNTWIEGVPTSPQLKSNYYKMAKTFFIPALNSIREDYYYSEIAGGGSFNWTYNKWEVVEDYLDHVTVQSKQYSNVFKSTMYYSWTVWNPPVYPHDTTIIVSEKWWAKDVGLIKCIGQCRLFDENYLEYGHLKDFNIELVEYHINK